MTETIKYQYNVPTAQKELFKDMVGKKVKKIQVHSFDSYAKYIEYLDWIGELSYRSEIDYVMYATSIWCIKLDDSVEYSFIDNEESNSVELRVEEKGIIVYDRKYGHEIIHISERESVKNITPISKDENIELGLDNVFDSEISKISILKCRILEGNYPSVPSETGILFQLKNGTKLLIAHRLLEVLFDFTVSVVPEVPPVAEVILEISTSNVSFH